MRNTVIMVVCFLINGITMQAMDGPAQQGPRDPNSALILATISGPLTKEELLDIDFLFKIGADPNFVSPLCGITHLMRAVRANQPELVELLLAKGAKVNVCHNKSKKFVRGFNMIYDKKEIRSSVDQIIDVMLQIETYNTLYPDQPIDLQKTLYDMQVSNRLRNALLIDRKLEFYGAPSGIIDSKHVLLLLLKKSHVRRALAYILDEDLNNVPLNVRVFYVLGNKKIMY